MGVSQLVSKWSARDGKFTSTFSRLKTTVATKTTETTIRTMKTIKTITTKRPQKPITTTETITTIKNITTITAIKPLTTKTTIKNITTITTIKPLTTKTTIRTKTTRKKYKKHNNHNNHKRTNDFFSCGQAKKTDVKRVWKGGFRVHVPHCQGLLHACTVLLLGTTAPSVKRTPRLSGARAGHCARRLQITTKHSAFPIVRAHCLTVRC